MANQTITLVSSTPGVFLNALLIPALDNTVLGTTNAEGILQISFLKPSFATGNITVSNGIANTTYSLPTCDAANCQVDTVPTMSEWGLIIFGLIILNLAILFLKGKEELVLKKKYNPI